MKLRTYLLIASGTSIGFILVSLTISYLKMLLTLNEMIWLSGITIAAGILSFGIHYFLTRPLEQSIQRITEESKKIASGDFKGLVPTVGPVEFRMLAGQFNEMSQKLEASFEQLRSSEASRRELVANVSHDLRTPLASIQSFVEALQDDVIQDRQTFRRYLETISLETQRLGVLVDDLFQLSRLQSGAEPFTPGPYQFDSLLLETLQSLQFRLENKNLEVHADIPECLPPATIMPNQIRRVLSNLLDNAIRYSPIEGSIRLKASVTPEKMLEIIVADEGEGISESEQARIFERFYRTDKSRHRESGGAGLGLAIAKSLIELHGGKIGVNCQIGQGCAFWFTIPIHTSDL